MPMPTSEVDGAFLLLNTVKTDLRINLNTATVEYRMIFSLEGPEEKDAAAAACEKMVPQ